MRKQLKEDGAQKQMTTDYEPFTEVSRLRAGD